MNIKALSTFTLIAGLASPASAINIVIDYSLDSSGFFSNNTAKSALDQAAADLSGILGGSLSGVSTNTVSASSGPGDSMTRGGNRFFSNPSTGASETRDFAANPIAADTYVVYAGARNLANSTLGQGGFSNGIGGGSVGSNFSATTATAIESTYIDTFGRGGPILSSFDLTTNGHDYTLNNGLLIGNITFDIDTDNNGAADDAAMLANYWHYDHTSAVASGKNDLYSVALHELLHTIGIGSGENWDVNVSGTNWIGAAVIAENGGSGNNLIEADGNHIRDNTMSTRLSDGTAQEVVMGPSITTGTRKELTALDVAFLNDLGFQTIPEPTSSTLLGIGAFTLLLRRRK